MGFSRSASTTFFLNNSLFFLYYTVYRHKEATVFEFLCVLVWKIDLMQVFVWRDMGNINEILVGEEQ